MSKHKLGCFYGDHRLVREGVTHRMCTTDTVMDERKTHDGMHE